ncbi:bifunctional PIG-L family deacetylase/class I SAM-dependent methyltransferase [Plantibacter flavus]|uniref:PIG-L family deacetylase n=1 Tax=Plantibacter flavus TaxID=150123 RepID=UPI003F16C8E1
MPAFDHRDPGTSAAAWATRLHELDLDAWDGWRAATGIVVLSPHPDDESLGVGGLIAAAASAGVPVLVILVTLGEGSHPDSPTTTPESLARVREREFTDALARLHPQVRHVLLRVPDGGLDDERPRLALALRDAIDAAGDRPLIVAPWRGDGHRDHRVAGEIAAALAGERGVAFAEFPIWLWHWAATDDETLPWADARTVGLDAAAHGAKIAAMDAYPSQTEPLSDAPGDEAIVDHHHLQHYARRFEVLFPDARALALGGPSAGRSDASSRSRDSFDAHYREHPDGWDFGSWYEERKREVLLAALPRRRYGSVLEIGCATGVLAGRLSERSDDVLGVDIAEAPLAVARLAVPTARFERLTVPEEWPTGRFDLVVLSEVGYYLSVADLDGVIDRVLASLADGGSVVACHWRHPDDHAATSASFVHRRLLERWPGRHAVQHVEDDFLLDVLVDRSEPSVAAQHGLAR